MHYINIIKLNILNLYPNIVIFKEEINFFKLALIEFTKWQNISNFDLVLIFISKK